MYHTYKICHDDSAGNCGTLSVPQNTERREPLRRHDNYM